MKEVWVFYLWKHISWADHSLINDSGFLIFQEFKKFRYCFQFLISLSIVLFAIRGGGFSLKNHYSDQEFHHQLRGSVFLSFLHLGVIKKCSYKRTQRLSPFQALSAIWISSGSQFGCTLHQTQHYWALAQDSDRVPPAPLSPCPSLARLS